MTSSLMFASFLISEVFFQVTLKSTGQVPTVVLIFISKTAVEWRIKTNLVTIQKVHVSDLQY